MSAGRRRTARLDKLHRVLQRIEEGEFGWCEACGGEIAEGRLRVDPAARLCVACARAQER
jgi:DnaK suppressor protein